MRKLTILFSLLTLSVGVWANSITYTAPSELSIGGDAFIPSSDKQFFLNGVGHIYFSHGDVTEIKDSAFKNRSGLTSITLPNTVTRMGGYTFAGCDGLTSFTIPASVTTIGNYAFVACKYLTSITFEGAACQYAIGEGAFQYVGNNNETITNLTLPEDWNYANAPTNNTTFWYGGYFNSNLYSEDEATDKQAAIDALVAFLGEYITSTHFQSLLAEETTKINSAVNRHQVNERKQAAIDRLTFAIGSFRAGKAEALGSMGEPCTDCTAVEVKKGDKTVILYAPESVDYIVK